MGRPMQAFLISILLCAVAAFAQTPQPQAAPPNKTVIISFLVPIDNNSIGGLLHVVNEQVTGGAKNIVLLISSPGGDTTSAFAAYSVLRHIPAEVTTFNIGAVDSAGMVLYCAGKHRFSMPEARFLIHGNSLVGTGNNVLPGAYTATFLEAEVAQLKSLNSITVQVLTETANKKAAPEIESAVQSQRILNAEQAKDWGIVNEIKTDFMQPGATMVSVNVPDGDGNKTVAPYTSVTPKTETGR